MNEYVKKISQKTGKSPYSTLLRMKRAKRLFGITYKEYYNNEMYDIPEDLMGKEIQKIRRKKDKRFEAYDRIINNSDMSKSEIISELGRINEKGIKRINVLIYDKFRMYDLSEEEVEELLKRLNERDDLCREIKDGFKDIDIGEKEYADIAEKISRLKGMIKSMMTPTFKEKLKAMYLKGREYPETERLDDILVDMDATRLLLDFSFTEYLSFHFEDKSFEEKRTYMSNKERMEVLSEYNDELSCNMLDDKAKCYKALASKFGRKQVFIRGKMDIMRFKRFCSGRKVFVKKALSKSMGKGIEPVYLDDKTGIKELMNRFLDESGAFIAEELIHQHESMSAFNRSSVNTVRIETYFDGKDVRIMDSFMKVGQNGAFVDNGGAGGIFIAVDTNTGTLISDGCDELGKTYEKHPQSGVRFSECRLADWDKAIELVKGIGDKFPGISFIGWDLAYTEEGKWIIVEGNAKPQIIGNQSTQGRGLRKDFLEKTKYSESKRRSN